MQGHAVIIGVGDDLPVTIGDAKAVANLLMDSRRCGYPAGQVRVLVGGAVSATDRPTRENILAALDDLAERCCRDEESIAIVYYSGHGGKRADVGQYYLLPEGFDPDDFARTAITDAEFCEKIRRIPAKGVLVLLDCCHAGGISSVGQASKGSTRDSSFVDGPFLPDYSELGGMNGRAFISSCGRDQKSWFGKHYSVFTEALLEALAGYGCRQRDGRAYFLDVLHWISQSVPKRARGDQIPILDTSQLTINFPLAFYAGGELLPKGLDWAGPVPQPANIPQAGSRSLPLLHAPDPRLLIDAVADLTEGQLAQIAQELGINPADLPRGDHRSRAVEIVRRAGLDRGEDRSAHQSGTQIQPRRPPLNSDARGEVSPANFGGMPRVSSIGLPKISRIIG
ncbi:caspase family protein [Isosphaeraceae bacterium EP7]